MYKETEYINKTTDYYEEFRPEIIPFIPRKIKKILDVGCGVGGFGKNLKDIFSDVIVWGVEPNKDAADKAAENLDVAIHSYFSNAIPQLQNEKFDCITFNDVLEHLTDPDTALIHCKSLLTKNGKIVASIPNVQFFPVMYDLIKNGEWKYTDSGVLDNTHVKFYTKKSIIRLFEENDFSIEKIEGINVKIHNKYKLYCILNFFLFNKLKNWKYMQFVVVASKK